MRSKVHMDELLGTAWQWDEEEDLFMAPSDQEIQRLLDELVKSLTA